jgi:hypothetical protein
MRRAIWFVAIVALMGASFALGRGSVGLRSLTAVVATLPGEEVGFRKGFDGRIRHRFPVGTSEDALIGNSSVKGFCPNGVVATTPMQARSFQME